MTSSALFRPVSIGDLKLEHSVVLAPLTRLRNDAGHAPGPLAVEYYSQRASVPGTLLISEGTVVSERGGGLVGAPGIYTEAQIAAWKKVVDVVHAKGSFIYMQLFAFGRAAQPEALEREGGYPYVAPSPIALTGNPATPRALSVEEIEEYVLDFGTAAAAAVDGAGFDGVEIHFANGYLIDQFLNENSNQRTDQYGGSIENRAKFALDVVAASAKAVGAKRTAVRLSPWGTFQDMDISKPQPLYTHVITRLRDEYPALAYVHVLEPRISGAMDKPDDEDTSGQSNDFIQDIWAPRPFIRAGGFDGISGAKEADRSGSLIAYGRLFISNPDLPRRIQDSIPLSKGDRSHYYTRGAVGYTDYPTADQISRPTL
ncbi:NADH:flavin oxidoreductase/NADH oxidase [Athelia psychrophila]|uniref:NADH:flavin oxidoreductase/NADH oxidase n=1 Tax=Athelia psychrophila TaxID=1759441 RepID=A0A166IEM3_9AGAM|nr:NADH:flavin oxidoreductase/NADH oxidase [Fibularhizoctonia sp. CBS 109695]